MIKEPIVVWYVQGDREAGGKPLLWQNKEDAERWARDIYPYESPAERYARIFYVVSHSYADYKR